jgi:phospholipase/carboxylesterase
VNIPSESLTQHFRGWTLRVRESLGTAARVVLLVHGWTGDENSMWVFVRNFPPDRWIVAPRAPYRTMPSGYSWRPPPPERQLPAMDDLEPAALDLLRFIDEYAADRSLEAGMIDAIGFSQGAALVNTLLLLRPERIHRAGVLAGFVPLGADELLAGRRLEGKAVFVAHGSLDELVPVAAARESVRLLEQAGANVTYCEDNVGHKLSAVCMHALERFFA